jgi:2-polyprenyl-3-methyl-5-hydroxy-6-metoxy-1,4-benzoquinol methylase
MNQAPVKLESVDCPLGCRADDEFLFSARDRLHGLPGEFRVVRCRSCGLVRTNPRPTPDTIGFYYPENYGPYLGTQIRVQQRAEVGPLRKALRWLYRRLVRFNTEIVPELPPGRMLEVGCASGSFLAAMAAAGWQVEGIEFSDTAAQRARDAGFKVQTGTLESAVANDRSFDLIAGWMVIEHLHDPVAALRKLARWSKPDGRLCLSVPNCASLEFRLFGPAWYALQVPTHLYHFAPRTIEALLKHSGWTVERIFHQRILNNLVASIGNWLEDRGASPRLAGALQRFPDHAGRWSLILYPLAWLLSLAGQTGRVTVWARKSEHAA